MTEEEDFGLQEEFGSKAHFAKRLVLILSILMFLGAGAFFIYQYSRGTFKDPESFRNYINSFGIYGPVLLSLIQCFKVIYAIIPGAIGCIVGAGLFGTVGGFICNYIGICAGSMITFLLSKKLGIKMMRLIFSEKKFNSYIKWMNKYRKSYGVFLWIAILIPISPDDFLCYFSGLTDMKFKKFAMIILTAKPWAILGYSLIFGNLFN